MPRTNFTTSTPITSEFLNKVARPRISTVDDDGAISPLTNADLDNSPGSLLFDFYSLASALQVVQGNAGGLSITVKGGTVRRTDGTSLRISDTTLSVPNNAVSFVWVDSVGTIQVTPNRPNIGAVLATITTVNGSITNIADDRVNIEVRPRTTIIGVFGGQSTEDYIIPANTTQVLTGSIECRNFILPASSSIQVRENLTIRASGDVNIFGNITSFYASNPIPQFDATLGGGTFHSAVQTGEQTVDSVGYAIRSVRRTRFYPGNLVLTAFGQTISASQAVRFQFVTSALNADSAANGGELKINAAGRLTIGQNVQINMRPKQATPPSGYVPNTLLANPHPTTGQATANWGASLALTSGQGAAGNIILQSVTAIDIQQNVVLDCKGSDQGWAYLYAVTEAGVVSQPQPFGNNHLKPGAGGGGGIWLHAPIVLSHPSVIYNVSAGFMNTPSVTNNYIAGVGGVGKGFTGGGSSAITSFNEAKPGTLTTNIGFPIEF